MSERDLADSTVDLPTLASRDALEVVQGYMLMRMLDETSVARSYECRSEKSGEFVRVHVLQKDLVSDIARKNRVLRDCRLVMALRNQKGLARILEVGEGAAGPFIVLEQVAAGSLMQQLGEQERLPVLEALAVIRDVAVALEAAHQAGVTHRDLTPARIGRSTDGTIKLFGFGLAPLMKGEGVAEGLFGTPEVTAPELLRGAVPDARSDVYALGATLFWLITGKPLFSGSVAEVLAAQQKKPVPSIASLVPDAGIAVVDILYRLLQKEPGRRPQTAAEVATLLEQAIARMQRDSGAPLSAVPTTGAEPAWPTMRTDPPVVARTPRVELPVPPRTGGASFDAQLDAPTANDANPYAAQPTGVMGSLKQMSVTEILQTLEIGKKSARVDVHAIDGDRGTMHIHDGQIVHGSTASLQGEPAVAFLIKKTDGFFRIHYEKEPCERNVTRPTTFVLLEAMRQLDESGAVPSANASQEFSDPMAAALPPAPAAPPVQAPSDPPAPAAVAAPERVPLARPLPSVALPELFLPQAPPTGLGDGIDFNEPDSRRPRSAPTEDATTRQGVLNASAALARVRRAAAQAWHALRVQAPLWLADAERRFSPLRPRMARVHPRLARVPLWQLGTLGGVLLASMLIVVVGMASGGTSLRGRRAIDAVLDGDAAAVAEALSALPAFERSSTDDLALAHALLALGEGALAMPRYGDALSGGALDAHELRALLDRLDGERPDDEVDLLVLWPDFEVEDELAPLTLSADFHVRENAVAVLVERGALGRLSVEDSARLDLRDAPSCVQRKRALVALRAAGMSEATRAAVEEAGRSEDNRCFRGELPSTYDSVVRRIRDALQGR